MKQDETSSVKKKQSWKKKEAKKQQPATRAVRGQMTSCIAASLLYCRALLSFVGGWRWVVEGGGGGRFLFLSLLFFCIRWIQSRAHGLGSVFGPRDVLLSLSLSLSLSWNGHGQFT